MAWGLPDPIFLGIKQPLNGIFKHLCRFRVKDPQGTVLQNLRKLFLLGQVSPPWPQSVHPVSGAGRAGQTEFSMNPISMI